jgi:hypothetical protein
MARELWERTKKAASRGLASLLVAGAGVLALADNSAASIIDVIGIGDVVTASPDSRTYESYNVTLQGNPSDYKLMILPFKFGDVGTEYEYQPLLVGGLQTNPLNPRQPKTRAGGYINQEDTNFFGLNVGDVIGTAVPGRIVGGKIPAINGNVAGGLLAFVDYNGDGKVGTKDTSTGVITPDPGELILPYKVIYSGFSLFPASGKGTITSINIRPEMSYIADILPQINPKNKNDTRVKVGWLEFDFYGDKIFTQTSTNPPESKLDTKYRTTFWEDVNKDGIGDGNWDGTNDDRQLLDAVTGQPVFQDNHVIYICPDISLYALNDGSGEYKMHAFQFGYPEFVLPTDKELHSVYAKVENLQDGIPGFIQFEPYYSDTFEVETTPEPATLGLVGLGALGLLARRKKY